MKWEALPDGGGPRAETMPNLEALESKGIEEKECRRQIGEVPGVVPNLVQ